MNVFTSTYSFQTIIENTPVVAINTNTVHFQNNGETDIVLNDSYTIKAGTGLTLGGRLNCKVVQNFDVKFSGGAGVLSIINETIN